MVATALSRRKHAHNLNTRTYVKSYTQNETGNKMQDEAQTYATAVAVVTFLRTTSADFFLTHSSLETEDDLFYHYYFYCNFFLDSVG